SGRGAVPLFGRRPARMPRHELRAWCRMDPRFACPEPGPDRCAVGSRCQPCSAATRLATGLILAQMLMHNAAARVTAAGPTAFKLDVGKGLGIDGTRAVAAGGQSEDHPYNARIGAANGCLRTVDRGVHIVVLWVLDAGLVGVPLDRARGGQMS